MPLITISLLQGRTVEQKRKLHEAVAEAVHQSIGAPKERIRIQLIEMLPENYSMAGKTAEK